MPTYVYKFVDTGETIEIQQSFSDDTLTEAVHPDTGAPMAVKKVFQPVGVTFKGDGFYKTDSRASNGSKNNSKTSDTSDSTSSSSDGSSSSSDSSSSSGDSSSSSSDGSSSSSDSSGSAKPAATASSD